MKLLGVEEGVEDGCLKRMRSAGLNQLIEPFQKEAAEDRTLAGGVSFTTPFGAFVSPDITPDPETGVGKWSNDDFKTLFRTGKRKSGAQIVANFMPWYIYKNMSDADLDAVIAYLRTLPPVKNDVNNTKNQFQLGG